MPDYQIRDLVFVEIDGCEVKITFETATPEHADRLAADLATELSHDRLNLTKLQVALSTLLGHCKELLASEQLHRKQEIKLQALIHQIEKVLDAKD